MNLILLAFAPLFITTSVEPQQQILNRSLGNWESKTFLKKSLWIPKVNQLVQKHNI